MARHTDWTEDRVRRLYHLRVSERASSAETARILGVTRSMVEAFCSNHFMTPVTEPAPLSDVLEIYRHSRGQGGAPRMSDEDEARLRSLWSAPGACVRSVGLALHWRRELLIKRAFSLRLGPVGDPLPDTPAARAPAGQGAWPTPRAWLRGPCAASLQARRQGWPPEGLHRVFVQAWPPAHGVLHALRVRP